MKRDGAALDLLDCRKAGRRADLRLAAADEPGEADDSRRRAHLDGGHRETRRSRVVRFGGPRGRTSPGSKLTWGKESRRSAGRSSARPAPSGWSMRASTVADVGGPFAQHRDAVADLLDLGHPVGDVDDRHALALSATPPGRRAVLTSRSVKDERSAHRGFRILGSVSNRLGDLGHLLLGGGAQRRDRRGGGECRSRARATMSPRPGAHGALVEHDAGRLGSAPRKIVSARTVQLGREAELLEHRGDAPADAHRARISRGPPARR